MTKTDLVSVLSKKTGFTKTDLSIIVDSLLTTIIETLSNGEEVKLSGFGNFSIVDRAARKGRNPVNGEIIDIAPTRAPKFKPGAPLKEAIKGA